MIKHDLHGDKIVRFAKLLLQNYEGFQTLVSKPEIQEQLKVGNEGFTTFDIMRNYLNDEELRKIIEHLVKLSFDFDYLILTANNLTIVDTYCLQRVQKLILSRNKIKHFQLVETLNRIPSLLELDLSQNLIESIQTEKKSVESKLRILNLSRNCITKVEEVIVLPSLEQLFLFGNYISTPFEEMCSIINSSFQNLTELSLHGNPSVEVMLDIPDFNEDPVAFRTEYLQFLKRKNPSLKVIDGH